MRASVAILSLFCVAVLASESRYQTAFTDYMQKYSKSYHSDEFQARYKIFKQNMDFVEAHNMNNMKSYKLAMNAFGDLSHDEFKKYYLGLQMPSNFNAATWGADFSLNATAPAPASVDWRTKGAVTPIKNQGQCGSCWSFSTPGSTEGCHAITTGNLVALSEQNLMDCSTSYGNQGCNGGLMTQAMEYIIANKGIDTESSYPYTAQDGTSCRYSSANRGATLKSYSNVASGSESALQTAVVSGPVSVAIDASQNSFQFYSSGVYYEPACSSQSLDHGVLAAGYGTSGSSAYWLVKNSWGTSWGLSGYIWMSRNRNNNCGIATMATLPSC
jgi:cathepsin L